MKCLFIIINF